MQIIERPTAGQRKIHSSNEFELCYIRHQYFRKVKYNPTEQEMAPYQRIAKYLAQRTFYTYTGLFHLVGMTVEDVIAVSNIHIVNFIGLFEIGPNKNEDKYAVFRNLFEQIKKRLPNHEDLLSKNKANMTLFVKQRMEDLVRICKQKAKNIKGFRVDEYIPFYGPVEPPEDLYRLLIDNEAYGYYRCDLNLYRAVKKKKKAKLTDRIWYAGNFYVTVPLDQRSITILDLAGAGMDPYENIHNLNPEEILARKEKEIGFDKRLKRYKNSSKEEKAKTILDFIEKNSENPNYQEEIVTARKLLRNMGFLDAGTVPNNR